MTNNQRNDRDEARHLMVSGMALIVASFLLGIFLVVAGCSGGHRKMPTDPAGSKPIDQSPSTDQGIIGDADQGDISDQTTRESTGEWSWALPIIMELFTQGGGQAGNPLAFQPTVYCAVFDSTDRSPIEGAYVSAGSDGTVVDATDVYGRVILDAATQITPGEPIYLTAGAVDYVMQSESFLINNVYVFFLDPLTPPTPAFATLNGTVDFQTDDFYAEIYSTNMISAVDAVLEPSAPGDEDDTYEIKIIPGTTGRLYSTLRDTSTNDIISFKIVELREPVAEDDSYTVDFEHSLITDGIMDEVPGLPSGDLFVSAESALYDYISNAKPFQTLFTLEYHDTSPIDTLSSSINYYDSRLAAYVPMSDTVIWSGTGQQRTNDTTLLKFNILPLVTAQEGLDGSSDSSVIIQNVFPLQSAINKLDVTYEDGSGTSMIWNTYGGAEASQLSFLPVPPAIDSPTDGALGVTLNPTFDYSWDIENNLPGGHYQLRLVDSVNANVWVINIKPVDGVFSTQLPTLPAEQESWGLSIGNEVLAIIQELSEFPTTDSVRGILTSSTSDILEQSNYSGVYHFTP